MKPRLRWAVAVCLAFVWASAASPAQAGPPYETDDPEPVACHHLEVDVAQARQGIDAGTSPTYEVDYGPTQNIELSVAGQRGELQLGSALRFISETKSRPQVAFLPALTFHSDGTKETLLPIWLQKTVKQWTAFGGTAVSQSSTFSGIALIRNFRSGSSLGAEFFRESPRHAAPDPVLKFNLGYTAQLDETHALMFSAGRAFGSAPRFTFYLGYQVIVAPRAHAANCGS